MWAYDANIILEIIDLVFNVLTCRIAYSMIKDAEDKGLITPGKVFNGNSPILKLINHKSYAMNSVFWFSVNVNNFNQAHSTQTGFTLLKLIDKHVN